ncbi:MAG: hypothetical protein ACI94Y_000207 [Maribacter sp.]|jgi:hypothetical protein
MFEKDNNLSRKFKPLKVLFFIVVFMAIVAALASVVMLLWNAILPDTIGVKPLNFWKAAGLLILAKILFGGLRGRRGPWKHSGKKHWRNKWMEMNHEERKEAKSRWKDYCKRRDFGDKKG